MSWYVLYVLTGKEYEVQETLRSKGIKSVVPTENRVVRSRGQWLEREYILFQGYVFVHAALDAATYYKLRGTAGLVKLLDTGGVPSPLPEAEAKWIEHLSSEMVQPSTIEFMGGGVYRIVEGVLKELVNQIEHVDRHRRRVRVKLTIAGTPRYIELSYRVYQGTKS